MTSPRILIVGAGGIGMSAAIAFARGGAIVTVVDVSAESRERALALAAAKLRVAHVPAGRAGDILERITIEADLAPAASTADVVLECSPERLEIKTAVFSELERHCRPDAVLASVSSTIPISASAGHLSSRGRAIVAHPVNPPHLLPLIELVPADFTAPETTERLRTLLEQVGMAPIVLAIEVPGFVVNRLQAALLREAMHLVRAGVTDPASIDLAVTSTLAPRWITGGPFATADLNTRGGFAAHAETIGAAYARFDDEWGGASAWSGDSVERVVAHRRAEVPLEQWEQAALRREEALAGILAALDAR